MRRAAKVDRNQGEIVKALRAAGCQVECLHAVGKGVPDLLVGRPYPPPTRGTRLFLLEVKDGEQPPSARGLTDDQVEWHRRWWGAAVVVATVDEALRAVGLLR